MRRLSGWLDAAALRLVPPDWREGVARDLREEIAADVRLSFAAQAARAGLRLRARRLWDTLARAAARRAPVPKGSFMRDAIHDAQTAVRSLIRRPDYAFAIVATLAVGIGANTAVYSIFNWILFRPLPGVARPHEIVTVRYQYPASNSRFWVSYRDYADLRDGVSAFAGLAASLPIEVNVTVGGLSGQRRAEMVTTNYFDLLGVAPVHGRAFTASEERSLEAAPPAILSHRLWRRAFEGRAGSLGQLLSIDGRQAVLAGVMPADFQGSSRLGQTDVWLPIGAYPVLQPQADAVFTSRSETTIGDSLGRLRPGATLAQAQAEAAAVAAGIPDFANRRPGADPTASITPMLSPGIDNDPVIQDRLASISRLLMGAVGLLLLLACANAANLFLARGAARRREIAVCEAIGASRFRIVRQHLAEAMVLSLCAGVLGLGLGVWLVSLFDGMQILSFLREITGVGVDWRVCAFALAAAGATGLAFGIIPAIAGSRSDLQASLRQAHPDRRPGPRALRGSLVVVQVSVSVLLLVGAGLFIRTLQNIRALDLGLDPDGVVSLFVNPGRYGHPADRSRAYMQDLLERVRRAPGIERAALTWTTAFSPARASLGFRRSDNAGPTVRALSTVVSPGFFDTMGIPIVAGRDFRPSDAAAGEDRRLVIVSRRLAAALFPDGGAVVGARLPLTSPQGATAEVIGVAADVRARHVVGDPEPWVYVLGRPTWGFILARSSLPDAHSIAALREAARALDPAVIPYQIEPFGASVDRALSEPRLFARMGGAFGAIGATLAAIGIYGLLAGTVAERRRELGIRLALGAQTSAIMALVLRTSAWLALGGAALGLGAATAAGRLVAARLYGVTPTDPMTLAATVGLIVSLSLLASLGPALRAARTDPVRSLRAE